MKKILILVLVLAGVAMSQTFTPQKNTVSSLGKYTQMKSAGGDTVASLIYVVDRDFSMPTGMTGSQLMATANDTLSGASDTVTFNFGNQFAFAYITLRDTTGGSGLVDSVVVEYYHSTLGAYSSRAIGLKDVSTDDLYTGQVIVPGQGLIKTYLVNLLYPGQILLRWYYGADKVGRVMPIVFRGSN